MAEQNIFSFFHEQLCTSSYMELVQKKKLQIQMISPEQFHISQKAAGHLWKIFDSAARDLLARGLPLITQPPKVSRGSLPTWGQANAMLDICLQWLELLTGDGAESRNIFSAKEISSQLLLIENDVIDHSLTKTIA